jgi:hypothetical protein
MWKHICNNIGIRENKKMDFPGGDWAIIFYARYLRSCHVIEILTNTDIGITLGTTIATTSILLYQTAAAT